MAGQEAELTDQQLDEMMGRLVIDEASVQASRRSRAEVEEIERAVRQLETASARIHAKYNEIATRTGADPATQVDGAELAADRETLSSLLADDYTFLSPFGHKEDKRRTMEVCFHNLVHYESFGEGGFSSSERELHVHGDTAVVVGRVEMRGSATMKNLDTGEVHRQDLSGTYRTSHTYVLEDDRWQLEASEMTKVPAKGEEAPVGHDEST